MIESFAGGIVIRFRRRNNSRIKTFLNFYQSRKLNMLYREKMAIVSYKNMAIVSYKKLSNSVNLSVTY